MVLSRVTGRGLDEEIRTQKVFPNYQSSPERASDAVEASYRELSVHLAKERDVNESRTLCDSTFRLCAVARNRPPLKSSINPRGGILCVDTRYRTTTPTPTYEDVWLATS
jgi:hypothetical protein